MKIKRFFLLIGLTSILSIGIVWLLYVSSERIMQQENPFIRRFPPGVVEYMEQIDLGYNSYYFAGYSKGMLYLGNYTAPLHLYQIDSSFQHSKEIRIMPERSEFSFRSVLVRVEDSDFFLFDGSVPCIYSGSVSDWKAYLIPDTIPYFTLIEPMEKNSFVLRSNAASTGRNTIGLLELGAQPNFNLLEEILLIQKGGDGVFDTDGFLNFNSSLNKIIYLYRYRNGYIIADDKGNVEQRVKTIDTIQQAQIKVAQIGNVRKMAAPPVSVHNYMTSYKHLLFIDSNLKGKYDSNKAWEISSTLDVYDLKNSRYLFSFYIEKYMGIRMSQMFVTDSHIFALVDTQLVKYGVKNNLQSELRN